MSVIENVGSSVSALTEQFNTITHNLANVGTAGYKRKINAFSKELAGKMKNNSEINVSTKFDFTQGNMEQTANPLDLAICGKGFFVIETENGPVYTRNGAFSRNQNGQITDAIGRIVQGDGGPITIATDIANSEITVGIDGTITAAGNSAGKLKLVDFGDNEQKLAPIGNNYYKPTNDKIKPSPAKNLIVKQGYKEGSNVQMMEELVNMIMVTRLYEANMKMISAKRKAANAIIDVAMA